MYFVYQITNPHNHKLYIGISNNPQLRFNAHKNSKYAIGNAIRKYSLTYDNVSILRVVPNVYYAQVIERNLVDIEFINRNDTYNETCGGGGSPCPSIKTRMRMSESAKNRPHPSHTEESKMKMSIIHTGKIISDKQRAKISKTLTGRKQSKSTIDKRISSCTGLKKTDACKKLLSEHAKKRPVVKCPHCNKEGVRPSMIRWHFDNCKFKPTDTQA